MGQVGDSSQEILCVDLDGTLLKADLFYEGVNKALQSDILLFIKLVLTFLTSGKASCKALLAQSISLDFDSLPINQEVYDYLQREKSQGRKLILVTASYETWAAEIVRIYPIFDDLIASSAKFNCKGRNKLKALQAYLNGRPFEYIGNDTSDLDVWQSASTISVVSSNKNLIAKANRMKSVANVFDDGRSYKKVIRALRPHQWAKNILLFIPLFMAQEFRSCLHWFDTILAFIAFSLVASSVYIFNDLSDLSSDRKHAAKKHRPLAAGNWGIDSALLLCPALLFSGMLLASGINSNFLYTIIFYFIITTLYSFSLKRIAILDIMVLAFLYALRVFAGGAATGIIVSPWLIAFSVFFFLSLASLKRYIELLKTSVQSEELIAGRGYCPKDLPIISQAGIGSGLLAVLVLALYINSDTVLRYYSQAEYLWMLCFLQLYWLIRVWILANRELVHEDPVVFALKDKLSYVLIAIGAVIFVLAI